MMMRHEELRDKGLHVYDARGQRVAWVRGAEQLEHGVIVAVLVPVMYDGKPALAAVSSDHDACEAVGFVEGGVIR